MWFKQNTTQQNSINNISNCQSQLASIHSNGIELAMAELLHYQNKTALIDLSAQKNIHGQMSGNYLSRSKGRGMEFDEVRHYQTGDDIRAIDWRVTARTGKTHTKLFREEIERPVLIATDLSASMHFGSQLLFKSVQAAHLASLVAWHGKNRGDRLGGIVFNQDDHLELKPRSRKEGVLHYLHALTTLHQSQHKRQYQPNTHQGIEHDTDNNYFSDNCARVRQIAKPGSLVYLITDAQQIKSDNAPQQQEALRHLTHISQHCELVVCLIKDALEQELPESAVKLNVNLTDGEQRQQLTLGDKATATAYKTQASKANKQCQQALVKAGARVISLNAGQTLEQQLKNGEQFCNR
ncbi:MAG: DUF58 domain-containing protein [Colwellia sp.]|nr:DUF58 domain-containing protein [Colwellia sp.]MCW9080731.1 DUF58 domain-containing protein [Colwellia sp.]